jgi:CRP/FNR family cyclic AMP-dependent transcriptional regulator
VPFHPIRRGARKLVDALDRREAQRDPRAPAAPAACWGLPNLDLFREVPREELATLAADPRPERYLRRDTVIIDDDAVRVILEGGIKLTRVGLSGRKLIVGLLGPGDVFGRIVASDADDSYVIEALEESEVLALPREAFARLLGRAEFAYRVVQYLEEHQRELVRRVESLVFKDVRTRLIETLLALAHEHGQTCEHGMAVDVRITQQDLADLVGASRQIVNQILGELSRKLYVRRMGRVLCILNRNRLERLVEGPVSTS